MERSRREKQCRPQFGGEGIVKGIAAQLWVAGDIKNADCNFAICEANVMFSPRFLCATLGARNTVRLFRDDVNGS